MIFDPLDPDPDLIKIEDIAHALSLQCRFAGHTSQFYSVAEHSVRVSWRCSPENELAGLMHDASEYVLGDITTPLKADPAFGNYYRECEDRLMVILAEKFQFPWPLPAEVKVQDAILLATEVRDLMPSLSTPSEKELWKPYLTVSPQADKIEPYSSNLARRVFLVVFNRLQ